jgi:hypothetical protein
MLVRWFVQQNMSSKVIFSRNHAGSGPLLVAASQGHHGLVQYLCDVASERFGDAEKTKMIITHTNKFGETALKAACKGAYLEVACLLILYGGCSENFHADYFPTKQARTSLGKLIRLKIECARFMAKRIRKRRSVQSNEEMLKVDSLLDWLMKPQQANVYQIVVSYIGLPSSSSQLNNLIIALQLL